MGNFFPLSSRSSFSLIHLIHFLSMSLWYLYLGETLFLMTSVFTYIFCKSQFSLCEVFHLSSTCVTQKDTIFYLLKCAIYSEVFISGFLCYHSTKFYYCLWSFYLLCCNIHLVIVKCHGYVSGWIFVGVQLWVWVLIGLLPIPPPKKSHLILISQCNDSL